MSTSEWLPLDEDHQPVVGTDIEVCRYYVDEHMWWHRTWIPRGEVYFLGASDLPWIERYGVHMVSLHRADTVDDQEIPDMPESPDIPGDHIFWRPCDE